MRVASATMVVAQEAASVADRLLARPRAVLASLVGAQLLGTLALAATAQRNGWVFYQGGDQIGLATTGWLLGRLELPPTVTSYLWPLVLAPITWLTGPTYLQALPVLVSLQVLVLAPLALLCVYGIAAHIGGRLLGYWAALLWVAAPFAVIPLFVERYEERWVDQFLPQALGLTAMADFPSMVVLLAAALFLVRSLPGDRLTDAALAGILAGAAGGLKPANYLFLGGAVLAYGAARRWREGIVFAGLVGASVAVLAFWKVRGLGTLPVLALEQAHLAASAVAPLALDLDLERYFDLSLDHWRRQMDELREFFWGPRVAQWAPFAGALAILRVRRGAIAALLGGWLAAFLVVKGFSPRASIESNTFWRLLMPAWPAYLLLLAAIPLLVPTLARRLGERLRTPSSRPARLRWVALAATSTLALPVAATATATRIAPPDPPAIVQEFPNGTTMLTPIDEGFTLALERTGDGVTIRWRETARWRARVFYRVYRADGSDSDLRCVTEGGVAWNCFLGGTSLATTRERELVDRDAAPGAIYRVGVATNWADDPTAGDVFAFSRPAVAPP
ncbi:MAG: hypothetical protein RMM28_02370 [Thermoleophilia bacterium]|nr:hypothetical protein [Gaiellaceae bacterium]MDW8337967.1 hypothetical protein [Thermoleophilia bacterium]